MSKLNKIQALNKTKKTKALKEITKKTVSVSKTAKPTKKTTLKTFKVGCHVSIAGGLWNAPENAAILDCQTFQIFSRSPHGGNPGLINKEMQDKFATNMSKYGFSNFVIHAPYIINFGSNNPKTVNNSINIVRGELDRGTLLKADYVMFHPGSVKDLDPKTAIDQVITAIAKVLEVYNGTTKLLIEISAGAGNVVGSSFVEVGKMVKALTKYKGFGGVCYDTQHAFASGYDCRTPKSAEHSVLEFDKHIGLKWLKMSHVNDSKTELGSHKDRHEHINQGFITEKGILNLLKAWYKHGLYFPLILETNHDKVKEDIEILKTLVKKATKHK